ncbi:hypothetical protein G9A89_009857 [Geosiphon pyriformis]|nr:hypothetical protein G9A89_009857 [Geosiphon pyriformis]
MNIRRAQSNHSALSFETIDCSYAPNFSKLLETSDDHDMIIRVGSQAMSKSFKVHTLILKARCNYFKTALSTNWSKKDSSGRVTFEKPNIEPSVFALILSRVINRSDKTYNICTLKNSYIYSGQLKIENSGGDSDLFEMYLAADELLMTNLAESIRTHILDNYDRIYNTFDDKISTKVYDHYCRIYNSQNFQILASRLKTTLLKQPKLFLSSTSFLNSENIDALVRLLGHDDLEMCEIEIWEEAIRWGCAQDVSLSKEFSRWSNKEFESLQKKIDPFLALIRFYEISSVDYFYKVMPYKQILRKELRKDLKKFYLTEMDPALLFNCSRGSKRADKLRESLIAEDSRSVEPGESQILNDIGWEADCGNRIYYD